MNRPSRFGFLDGTLFLVLILLPVSALFAGSATLVLLGSA